MKWKGRRQSGNLEDRRGMSGGRVALGGGGAIIVVVIAMLMGADPRVLLNQIEMGLPDGQQQAGPVATTPEEEELKQFVATVLAETEDVWHELFRLQGREYQEPNLVVFTDRVESACGLASAAVGPFYCPGDSKVYLDLGFFDLLRQRLGAPGDFAQAYVIAHEIGHHVQNQLGITDRVHRARGQVSETEYNQLSVRLELQADFLAGVWAHHAQKKQQILDPGDIEEALGAASAIGDDKLQSESQGTVVPDSFTHGSSEQRVRWFRLGFETGDPAQGDTFEAERP